MKKIYSIVLLGFGLFFFSCSDVLELDDLLDNPNSPTPETADLESLYNSVQLGFGGVLSGPQFFTMQLSRQRAMTAGSIYETAFSPNSFDGIWGNFYSGFLPDAKAVIDIATPTQQFAHTGTTKVMMAYALMTMVDLFGAVPFSDAGNGIDNLSPTNQDGPTLYAEADRLLDEAISELTSNTAASPATDVMYGGNMTRWITAANTLKLRAAVYTRNTAAFNAIISGGDFISSASDDFQFQYGNNRNNPNARHPLYNNSYEVDDGHYLSNWFMWAVALDKAAPDPRARAFFYRQAAAVPLDNLNIFDCIFSVLPDPASTPQHYLDCSETMPYCVGSIDDGYYGRDHGNGNGIPPDGTFRTHYGVYPVGGKFDNGSFADTKNSGTDGALGAGIHPILPSFFVDFYQAEMAAISGDEAGARTFLEAAVQGSIDKAVGFIQNDPESLSEVVAMDLTTGEEILGEAFIPTADQATAFIAEVLDRYDAASDKLDIIAHEFLIATWGNGLEGYNLIRRTARPNGMQPTIQDISGPYIRSALYPSVNVNLNQSATQKNFSDQVFWDTNAPDLGPCFN